MVLALVGLSGATLGGLSSSVEAPQTSDVDTWTTFETGLVQGTSASEKAQVIKNSSIIRKFLSEEERRQLEEAEKVADSDIPPLPEVIGASIVDGQARVHLKAADERPFSLMAGDLLESGWVLRSVNLNGVVFKYGDVERAIAVNDVDMSDTDRHPPGGPAEQRN